MTVKECTKKRDARKKLLFCQSKPIAFLPFSLTSPPSLLSKFSILVTGPEDPKYGARGREILHLGTRDEGLEDVK